MNKTTKLVVSALCLALCLLLPFVTGAIPEVGKLLSPMHIPVLLCGFLCGAPWGAAVGFIAPFLRYALFHMPPLFPMGTAMAFEMAAYGLVAGLVYRALQSKTKSKLPAIYAAQIAAMVVGRLIFGLCMAVLLRMQGNAYTLSAFLTSAFVKGAVAMALHLLVVPPIVMAVENSGLLRKK